MEPPRKRFNGVETFEVPHISRDLGLSFEKCTGQARKPPREFISFRVGMRFFIINNNFLKI